MANPTHRDDPTDMGVPMQPAAPGAAKRGPEDALSEEPTRGDYRGRLGDANYRPHTVVPVDDARPGEPQVRVIAQDAAEIADKPAKKDK